MKILILMNGYFSLLVDIRYNPMKHPGKLDSPATKDHFA